MKKVIQFISSLSDGGAETLVKDYALLLDKNNFKVKIVVIQNVKNSANYKRLIGNDIDIIPIFEKYNYLSRIICRMFGRRYIPRKLRSIIRKEQPDCVHVHLPILHYLLPVATDLTKTKLLYTCHNVPSEMLEGTHEDEKEAVKYLIKNNNLQLIALHAAMAKELNEMFNVSNTAVIHNGVNFDKFQNINRNVNDIRREINVPENAFVIGHIGRFSKQKNQMFLIDILNELKCLRSDAFLLMIGDGGMKTTIEQKIKELGLEKSAMILSNRTDIPELLHAMNVFVFPSLFEGLPVTLVEAQAAGIRCVVSNRINPESILSDKTIVEELNSTARVWAEDIIDETRKNGVYSDLSIFDMNKEIRNLEALYKSSIRLVEI